MEVKTAVVTRTYPGTSGNFYLTNKKFLRDFVDPKWHIVGVRVVETSSSHLEVRATLEISYLDGDNWTNADVR